MIRNIESREVQFYPGVAYIEFSDELADGVYSRGREDEINSFIEIANGEVLSCEINWAHLEIETPRLSQIIEEIADSFENCNKPTNFELIFRF